MQTPPTNRHSQKPSNPYSPSVPISVYKELAAELQEAREMVQSLKSQNQQLVKQNQQLRQQVEKVVQSAQHLQQIVASFGSVSEAEVPRPQSPPPRAASIPEEFAPPPHNPEPVPPPYTETLVIEQEDSRAHRSPSSEGLSDVSGWMLLVAILLIVLTAFGTGFLIVRPLLNNNNKR